MNFAHHLSRSIHAFDALASILVSCLVSRNKLHLDNSLIVTASDVSHEKSLFQLLASLEEHRPNSRILVFNLGLSESSIQALMELDGRVEVMDFPYAEYPTWFQLENNSGAYAWKPICLRMALDYAKQSLGEAETLIWMDAGCTATSNLRVVEALAYRSGIFGNSARGTVMDWTKLESLEALEERMAVKVTALHLNSRQVSAAFLVFNLRSAWALKILNLWSDLAQVREVISPEGANKSNHRFDQSILSLLLVMLRAKHFRVVSWPQWLLGFKIHQDVD